MTGAASRWIFAVAGLFGAAGVAAAAAAAHVTGGGSLATAAEILMIHAAALTGLGAATRTGGGALCAVAAGLTFGAGLFGGDVALRALSDHRLFPMAAPIGGSILIGSWLVLAVLAIAGRVGSRDRS